MTSKKSIDLQAAKDSFSKLIVRMPNWLGDAVMATPVLEDLRKAFLKAEITVAASDAIATLLAQNPHVDRFLTFSRSQKAKKKDAQKFVQDLAKTEYDIGILLTGSFSSAWQFFRGNVPIRLGYDLHFRKFLLTHALKSPPNYETQHLVITYKELLGPLGIPLSETNPTLYTSDEEKKAALALLEKHDIHSDHTLIGINPGAAYGSAKCWMPDHFKTLALKLLDDPKIRIVFLGDNSTKSLVDDICKGLPLRAQNLAAKTSLRELIAVIDKCSCFITNDSGPMHVAAALNTPLVAIFGSTNEVKTGPYGAEENNRGTVIHKHVPCSPCYLRKCPIDFRCMKAITVDEVLEATQKYV